MEEGIGHSEVGIDQQSAMRKKTPDGDKRKNGDIKGEETPNTFTRLKAAAR